MASQYNAICDICGKHYYLCSSCKDMMEMQPWKLHTDTAEHFKIYQVLHGYNTGVYDIAEAKSKLKTINLSDKDTFVKEIKEVIDKILAYKDKSVKVVKNSVESDVEEVKPNPKKAKKLNKKADTADN